MLHHHDNYTYLTSAPIHRVIPSMAVPTIISMLVTSLYNLADTFFVGRINTQATAAIGVVFSLMFFVQAFGFFFGHGSGNYISRELGARRQGNAEKMAATGFVLSFITGVLIMAAGLLLLRPLSLALGSTPSILPYTMDYLGIVLLGAPFLTASLTLNNQLRLQGNAAYSMVGIVTGAVLNVVLDPLLIFVCDLGIVGAAIATVVGQIVSCVILFFMTRHGGSIAIRFKNFSPTWQACKEILYGGSPSLNRQGMMCVSVMLLNHAAGSFGDAAIAGMSIVNRVSMLIMAFVIGLGQGFQPVCGFCYGAKLFPRLREAYWFTVKIGFVFLLCCACLGWFFSPQIIRIFRNDLEVIAVGTVALRWQLCTLPLNVFTMSGNMLTQTCRKPVAANILAAARNGLFFIPLIFVLPYLFGLQGVVICQSLSDICAFSLSIPMIRHTLTHL